MSVKRTTYLFRGIIVLLGLGGVGLLLFIGPKINLFLNDGQNGDIILFLFWLTALPVILILLNLWQISSELLKEAIFSIKNSSRLTKIAYLGIIESLIYAVAILIGLFQFQGNYPYFIICGAFFFLGLIISIIASLLSYVFKLASQIKTENDLTI